jgi:hypothetical protein
MQTIPPRKVLLFGGHMIDAPGRRKARFPADKEPVAANAIATTLDQIGVDPRDLAICGGACGGDLIFAEACLRHGIKLELYIPLDEPTFLAKSVDFADAAWHARFMQAKSSAKLHVMPNNLGVQQTMKPPYERCNLWMLDSASRFGQEKLVFICLWDGQRGDRPGGTGHLMKEAKQKTDQIYWLNTRMLWNS